MSDSDRLSDVDRRSLRILARSAKSATTGDRLSIRLEKAAETGSRADYEKAESTFDSLDPTERQQISSKAEKHAETERQLADTRRRRTVAPKPAPQTGAEPMEWTPIPQPEPPQAGAEPPPKAVTSKSTQPATGRQWQLGRIPGQPDGQPAAESKPKQAAKRAAPPPDLDEDGQSWDWKKVPDDAVMAGGKQGEPADAIERLRREMLGLDAGPSKRR